MSAAARKARHRQDPRYRAHLRTWRQQTGRRSGVGYGKGGGLAGKISKTARKSGAR